MFLWEWMSEENLIERLLIVHCNKSIHTTKEISHTWFWLHILIHFFLISNIYSASEHTISKAFEVESELQRIKINNLDMLIKIYTKINTKRGHWTRFWVIHLRAWNWNQGCFSRLYSGFSLKVPVAEERCNITGE